MRKRGYASNAGESEDGVSSIGVAVLNASSSPVAAVSVAAPVSRMPASMARRVAVPLAGPAAASPSNSPDPLARLPAGRRLGLVPARPVVGLACC